MSSGAVLRACALRVHGSKQRCMPALQDRAFPSESDSETMRKVLKWGVVPLNLEGHGMDHHSFSWASTNSPVNIRDFNHIQLYSAGWWEKKNEAPGSLLAFANE